MNHRRITETYNPFWMLQKPGEIQFVDDADAAITATSQPNGFYLLIVKVFLKNSGTEIIITGKDMMLGKKPVIVNGYKSIFFQPIDGILHFFGSHLTSWRDNAYL